MPYAANSGKNGIAFCGRNRKYRKNHHHFKAWTRIMPNKILMPALSPTMEKGKIVKWYVGVGDRVAAGDVIVDIETDKAVMEVEAVR